MRTLPTFSPGMGISATTLNTIIEEVKRLQKITVEAPLEMVESGGMSIRIAEHNDTVEYTLASDLDDYEIRGNRFFLFDSYGSTSFHPSSSYDLTGLSGGSAGYILFITNVATGDLIVKNEDSASDEINRFLLRADLTLTTDTTACFYYDPVNSRWRAIADADGGSTGGSVALVRTDSIADSLYYVAYLQEWNGATWDDGDEVRLIRTLQSQLDARYLANKIGTYTSFDAYEIGEFDPPCDFDRAGIISIIGLNTSGEPATSGCGVQQLGTCYKQINSGLLVRDAATADEDITYPHALLQYDNVSGVLLANGWNEPNVQGASGDPAYFGILLTTGAAYTCNLVSEGLGLINPAYAIGSNMGQYVNGILYSGLANPTPGLTFTGGILTDWECGDFGATCGLNVYLLSRSVYNTDQAALATTLAGIATDISTLYSSEGTDAGNITTLQGQMSTAQTDISTLQGQVGTNTGDIATLQGQMTTAQSDISMLQSQMDSYSPSTPGDWSGSPSTWTAAIDRLASAVAGLLGSPIP